MLLIKALFNWCIQLQKYFLLECISDSEAFENGNLFTQPCVHPVVAFPLFTTWLKFQNFQSICNGSCLRIFHLFLVQYDKRDDVQTPSHFHQKHQIAALSNFLKQRNFKKKIQTNIISFSLRTFNKILKREFKMILFRFLLYLEYESM